MYVSAKLLKKHIYPKRFSPFLLFFPFLFFQFFQPTPAVLLHCYMLHVTIRWFHMSRSCRGAPLLLPMSFHEVGHDLAVRLIHLVSVEQCLVGRQLLADG